MEQPGLEPLGAWGLWSAALALHGALLALAAGAALLSPLATWWAARRGDAPLAGLVVRWAGLLGIWTRVAGAVGGLLLLSAAWRASPTLAAALAPAWRGPAALEALGLSAALAAGVAWARAMRRGAGPGATAAPLGWLGAATALIALLAHQALLALLADPDVTLAQAGPWRALVTPLLAPRALWQAGAAAGLGGLALLATVGGAERGRLARLAALFGLAGAVVAGGGLWLTLRAAGPVTLDLGNGELPLAGDLLDAATWAALLLALGLAAVAWQAPQRPASASRLVAGVLWVLALSALAGSTLAAEGLRSPWALGRGRFGALYATGLDPDQVRGARTGGLRSLPALAPALAAATSGAGAERGRAIFGLACAPCHTVAGLNAIRPWVDGLPRVSVAALVRRVDRLAGRMPPFPGDAADVADLAEYLAGLDGAADAPPPPAPPDQAVASGRQVYERRCITCHRDIPLAPRLAGWTEGLAYRSLGRLPRLVPAMPPFGGDEEERRALAAYLAAVATGRAD